jgi:hypothetical protein
MNQSKKIIKIRWAKFGEHPICAGSFFKNIFLKDIHSFFYFVVVNKFILDDN